MSKLTEKQKRFADFYIELGNASEAARRAGYSPKTAFRIGQENMQKLTIRTYIQDRLAEKDAARIASQDEVLKTLTQILRGELSDEVVGFDQLGLTLRADKDTAIRDRIKAAELLGKRYGLFTEKLDITGPVKVVIEDDYGD